MGKPSREKGARREREIARIMGGKRGRAYSGEPDVETDLYAVSVKSRKTLPKHIEDAIRDANTKAQRTGKWPLVVLDYCRKGKPSVTLFCHPSAEEWESIHGT